MGEDKTPAKKVVKRVVKKAAAAPTPRQAGPQVRYGRPVTTTPRPKAKATAVSTKTASKPARPKIALATRVKSAQKAATSRGASAASGTAGAVKSTASRVSSTVGDGFHAVLAWRLPLLSPFPAAIVTGALVGLVSVGLALASKGLFNELRGVSGGGGRWGSLTFVVVAFIAFVLGEILMSAFGVPQARLTSFLGVVLTIVAMLGLFLGVADTAWGVLIVPVVAVTSYVLAFWLLELAESNATETD